MNHNNSVRLTGNIGNDVEAIVTADGLTIGNFSLATSSTSKAQTGETITHTEWHRCVIFGKYAELMCPKLLKGKRVHVIGAIRYRVFNNKQEQEIRVAEIIVESVLIIQGKDESSTTGN